MSRNYSMLSSANNSPLRLALLLVVGMLALCGPRLHAQDNTFGQESYVIDSIEVRGARPGTERAVIQYSGLRVSDRIFAGTDVVSNAVKNLMDRAVYSNVRIYFTPTDPVRKGILLTIEVSELPRIGVVTFVGNSELEEKDLKEFTGSIRTGNIYSPYETSRAAAKIKTKYAAEGYLSAVVSSATAPSATDSGRVDVTFSIEEGPEVRIGTVTIVGNQAVSSSELKGAMEDVKEKSWWQFWRSSKFEESALTKDVKRISDHYRSIGYIDAEAALDGKPVVDPITGRADIHIKVIEGNRVVLRSVSITGNTFYSNEALLRRLDVEVGEPYNQLRLEKNLNGNEEQTDVRSLYYDNGYLGFNASMNEVRSAGGDSMDVVISVTEGVQSSIRYVTIVGNTKTKDKVVRRELYTRPGDTFSKANVIRSLRGLANLNYFNPEKLQPDIRPVDATNVDITYQVEERPSDTFNASIGLSSQGLTGLLGVSFNNFSVGEPLLGGGGQVLNFNWEFGTYQTTFALGLTEPWLFDDPTSLGASIYYQTRDVGSLSSGSDYKLRQVGVSVNLGRRLRWPDDYFRVDLGVNYRRNDLSGNATESLYYRNGTELALALTLSRSSIDNPQFPTVGSRFSIGNTIAGLGNAEYNKTELKFDFYSPLAYVTENNPLVFYMNNEFGYLYDYGKFENIPPLSFYSMGGTAIGGVNVTPLRGYRDGSIGYQANGVALGQVYSKISGELRFAVSINPIPIYILAFAEAGNVWRHFSEVDPFDLKRSAGAGIRLTIPGVGLLGFDYGYGFDRDTYGVPGGWQFHFQFGR